MGYNEYNDGLNTKLIREGGIREIGGFQSGTTMNEGLLEVKDLMTLLYHGNQEGNWDEAPAKQSKAQGSVGASSDKWEVPKRVMVAKSGRKRES